MATKTAAKTTKTTKAQKPADPFFALVGATDLAVERVREARVAADKNVAQARAEFDKNLEAARVELTADNVQKRFGVIIEDVKALPTKALNQGVAAADEVTKGYEDLADRGEKLVKRIKNQKATKDLVEQVETTIALGKGAVTTARKAALDVRSSALATFTTGRHQATKVAEAVQTSVVNTVDAAEDNAEVAVTEVKAAAKRTRTAAKRTNTTATKAVKRTESSAKAATTSARKAATTSTKATKKAAEKVGD